MPSDQQPVSRRQPPEPCLPTLPEYDIFDSDYETMHTVPKESIAQVPLKSFNINRLVVCRNHANNCCVVGSLCKYVHVKVPIDSFPKRHVHVNYAWTSLDAISYPRLLACPNSHRITLSFPAPGKTDDFGEAQIGAAPLDRILLTEGAKTLLLGDNATTKPLECCKDFHVSRLCKKGAKCDDIHVVHIDPTAKRFQRAPCPRQTLLQLTKTSSSPCEPRAVHSDEALGIMSFSSSGVFQSASATPPLLKPGGARLHSNSSNGFCVDILSLCTDDGGMPLLSMPNFTSSANSSHSTPFLTGTGECSDAATTRTLSPDSAILEVALSRDDRHCSPVASAASIQKQRQNQFVWNPYATTDVAARRAAM